MGWQRMTDVDKKLIKLAIDKATSEFTERINFLGFERTKKWFWVRASEKSACFIHLHLKGISYGAPINYSVSFRVHAGYREYSDYFEALALNGPCSTDSDVRSKRYHHRFNAKSGSCYERCIDDLVRFVEDVAQLWFTQQSASQTQADEEVIKRSLKLLGIKHAKK